jgi:hypothetical protein
MTTDLEGGCYCGAVRYRITAAPLVVTHCHCKDCRRACGAPFITWMSLASEAFAYTAGAPKIHKSSATGNRAFCGTCGTSLAYHNDAHLEEIDVSAATLDDPAQVTPQDHVWSASMLSWVKMADGLPRLEKTHWESGYPEVG